MVLRVNEVTKDDAGEYRMLVKNEAGEARETINLNFSRKFCLLLFTGWSLLRADKTKPLLHDEQTQHTSMLSTCIDAFNGRDSVRKTTHHTCAQKDV